MHARAHIRVHTGPDIKQETDTDSRLDTGRGRASQQYDCMTNTTE